MKSPQDLVSNIKYIDKHLKRFNYKVIKYKNIIGKY